MKTSFAMLNDYLVGLQNCFDAALQIDHSGNIVVIQRVCAELAAATANNYRQM